VIPSLAPHAAKGRERCSGAIIKTILQDAQKTSLLLFWLKIRQCIASFFLHYPFDALLSRSLSFLFLLSSFPTLHSFNASLSQPNAIWKMHRK
jgi:hypothetical protein